MAKLPKIANIRVRLNKEDLIKAQNSAIQKGFYKGDEETKTANISEYIRTIIKAESKSFPSKKDLTALQNDLENINKLGRNFNQALKLIKESISYRRLFRPNSVPDEVEQDLLKLTENIESVSNEMTNIRRDIGNIITSYIKID